MIHGDNLAGGSAGAIYMLENCSATFGGDTSVLNNSATYDGGETFVQKARPCGTCIVYSSTRYLRSEMFVTVSPGGSRLLVLAGTVDGDVYDQTTWC